VLNLAIRANHEGHTGNAFEDLSVHALVFDHAEGVADFLVCIGQ
jgi:hypothetical protein